MDEEQHKTPANAQAKAEAVVQEFKDELGPFVVAAEQTRMAMVFTDAKAAGNPLIFANDSFLALTGYSRGEVLGQAFNSLMAPGGAPDMLEAIKVDFERDDGEGHDTEIRYCRKDGSVLWATVFISPVKNEVGEVVQHFASFVDTTRHKKEQDRLRFLLNELDHRTQNTLATVLAIARQTLRGIVDGKVLALFEGRILALSKTHSLLGSASWGRVVLRNVVDLILEPFGLHDQRKERFTLEAKADIRLRPKAALSLAMVFHELATNSAKYGALSVDDGRVTMSWGVECRADGEWMRLLWKESGGPRLVQPTRKGFGSRLIERGLAQELNGEVRLDYDPSGVSCEVVMPLPKGHGRSPND